MNLRRISLFILTATSLCLAETWTTIDYPGAANTWVRYITNQGDILGRWQDSSGNLQAFILQHHTGNFTRLECADAAEVRPMAMNARAEVVGTLKDASGRWHPFYMGELGGTCFNIEPKGSVGKDSYTGAYGISDAGEIAGQFQDGEGRYHGFLMRGEVFLTFDIVEGTWNGPWGMTPEGDMFGHFQATGDRMKGFRLGKEKLTVIEFPPGEENGMTCPFGGNAKGDLVGHYQRNGDQVRGFLLTKGEYVPLDFPDAIYTEAMSVNDTGTVVGVYIDKSNKRHGFMWRK